jgi:SAM-dependent methyltransferase
MNTTFQDYADEAQQWTLKGWDFSDLSDRWIEQPPAWNYRDKVINTLAGSQSLLDMGTGGGEFLSELPNLPKKVWATESYAPNQPIARARLKPLGILLAATIDGERLPFDDEEFDLVINRHDSFSANDVARILKLGGRFITQQVGGLDNQAINDAIAPGTYNKFSNWSLERAVSQLKNAGFKVETAIEDFPSTTFLDIGALIAYLKAIPWQIPSFSLATHSDALRELHRQIQRTGEFKTHSHRFLIEAVKPE